MQDRLEPGVLLFDVQYPERSSRLLIFFRWLLLIPHYLVLWLYGIAVYIVTIIAWFAILITGSYPRSLWDFTVGYMAYNANVASNMLFLRDEYPPFGPGDYPVQYDLVYPERLSRLLIFVKFLLVIPHLIVLWLLGVGLAIVWFIAFFAILITGKYPRGMFDFVVGVVRWYSRVMIYYYLLTDVYPPFSME